MFAEFPPTPTVVVLGHIHFIGVYLGNKKNSNVLLMEIEIPHHHVWVNLLWSITTPSPKGKQLQFLLFPLDGGIPLGANAVQNADHVCASGLQ